MVVGSLCRQCKFFHFSSSPLQLIGSPTDARNRLQKPTQFCTNKVTGAVLKANLTLMALVKYVRQPYMRDLASVQNLTYAPFFATTEVGWLIISSVIEPPLF